MKGFCEDRMGDKRGHCRHPTAQPRIRVFACGSANALKANRGLMSTGLVVVGLVQIYPGDVEKILDGELDGGTGKCHVVQRLSLAANVSLWIGARVGAGQGVVRVENLHVDTLRCIVQFMSARMGV